MSFHVPEDTRLSPDDHPDLGSDATAGQNGAFALPSPEPGWILFLICSDGSEHPDVDAWQWEHVSVQAARGVWQPIGKSRTPSWREMAFVKSVYWDDEDVVIQYHPRKSEYVNNHPNVLHLWRPKQAVIPTPPLELVGVK